MVHRFHLAHCVKCYNPPIYKGTIYGAWGALITIFGLFTGTVSICVYAICKRGVTLSILLISYAHFLSFAFTMCSYIYVIDYRQSWCCQMSTDWICIKFH